MTNLANTKRRDEMQLDKVGRRDSIIPERRGVSAQDYRPAGDMRTARRGDGGAEQLMRSLGILRKGTEDFADYSMRKYAVDEEASMAQGMADQALDRVDPELQKKSLGYSNAVSYGRTISAFNDAWEKFEPELQAYIEEQDDPDPEVRRRNVDAKIDSFYAGFALDPETGQPHAWLQNPASMRYVAGRISEQKPKVLSAANDKIEENLKTEAKAHFDVAFSAQYAETGTVDLDALRATLPPTVSDKEFSELVVQSASNAAAVQYKKGNYGQAVAILDGVLGTAPFVPEDPAVLEQAPGGEAAPAPMASLPGAAPAPAAPAPAKVPNPGRFKMDDLFKAVMYVESGGRASAVSPKGAVGTMQTMPGTLTDPGFGVRPAANNSPAELERVGKDYLKALLKYYDGNLPLALAAYNAGPGMMDDWLNGTNRTGKNPSKRRVPDPRKGGVSAEQFAQAIPFDETRKYVPKVMGRMGLVSGDAAASDAPAVEDPVTPDPQFRLRREEDDPVTAYERSGQLPQVKSKTPILLTPEDRARLSEQRQSYASRGKSEWKAKRREDQDFKTSELMFRAFGQGPALTTEDVKLAVSNGDIRPDQALGIWNYQRARAEKEQSDARADQALASQQQSDAERRRVNAIVAPILVGLMTGQYTVPQANARLTTALSRERNPNIIMGAVEAVNSASSQKERLVGNSPAYRDAGVRFRTKKTEWSRAVPPRAQGQVSAIFSAMEDEFNVRVARGEDPATVEKDVAAKYYPELEALKRPSLQQPAR